MARHIGLQREDERGEVLANYAPEGIPPEVLEFVPRHSACVRFIDPYGDTVFNQLQLPVLIGEFEQMVKDSPNAELSGRLSSVVAFLAASQGIHQYVRFVGD
jgi:hypothetical protein